MNAHVNQEVGAAHAVGRAVAFEAGRIEHVAASPEVEARLSKLLMLTVAMAVGSVASVTAVGFWLF